MSRPRYLGVTLRGSVTLLIGRSGRLAIFQGPAGTAGDPLGDLQRAHQPLQRMGESYPGGIFHRQSLAVFPLSSISWHKRWQSISPLSDFNSSLPPKVVSPIATC